MTNEQAVTAIKHKGFHLGACLRSHDSFPAGEGCNPNCPRFLHAEIDRLRAEQNGSYKEGTDND